MLIENACLRELNTFGVNARAQALMMLDSSDQLDGLEALRPELPRLVVGGGSNLLLTRDVPGLVLMPSWRGVTIRTDLQHPNGTVVEAEAGEPWAGFVAQTLQMGLAGLENLSLIPGHVGAAPVQNIGAYGVELKDRFVSLDAVHLASGETRTFTRDDCQFAYRHSAFKTPNPPGLPAWASQWLITRVRFVLKPFATLAAGDLQFDYPDLLAAFENAKITRPSPLDIAQAVIQIRRRKLPDPQVLGNAGSFFKNPVIPQAQWAEIAAKEPGTPHYPAEPSAGMPQVKVPAAWFIDRCGFKGYRVNHAGVHQQHALVLVNHGGASGADILHLAHEIIKTVKQRFGIELSPEPVVV